mmetsp:Transcript_86708/g.232583  ORF Transcript_86708/g.232583 Transcript_86708/m.232583 type:complete len:301 (-) Transcript_86708:451-1353(-)
MEDALALPGHREARPGLVRVRLRGPRRRAGRQGGHQEDGPPVRRRHGRQAHPARGGHPVAAEARQRRPPARRVRPRRRALGLQRALRGDGALRLGPQEAVPLGDVAQRAPPAPHAVDAALRAEVRALCGHLPQGPEASQLPGQPGLRRQDLRLRPRARAAVAGAGYTRPHRLRGDPLVSGAGGGPARLGVHGVHRRVGRRLHPLRARRPEACLCRQRPSRPDQEDSRRPRHARGGGALLAPGERPREVLPEKVPLRPQGAVACDPAQRQQRGCGGDRGDALLRPGSAGDRTGCHAAQVFR